MIKSYTFSAASGVAQFKNFDEATFAQKSGIFERRNAARRGREETREGEPRGVAPPKIAWWLAPRCHEGHHV